MQGQWLFAFPGRGAELLVKGVGDNAGADFGGKVANMPAGTAEAELLETWLEMGN